MWSFEPRELIGAAELAERILRVEGIEGVTFSGGEPFAQASSLAALGAILRRHGLNVVTFTGYTLERLTASDRRDWRNLLAVIDLLVAGPFVSELRADLPLRGSQNQRLVFLTERLRTHAGLASELARGVEYTIAPDGTVVVSGFP